MRSLSKVILDRSLLVALALLLIGLGIGSFQVGEMHHIGPNYVIAAWFGVGFFAMVAASLRGKLRRPLVLMYVLIWFVVHMLVTFEAAAHLPQLLWIFAVGLELSIGLGAAFYLFGRPPR